MVPYVEPLGLPSFVGGGRRDIIVFFVLTLTQLEASPAYDAGAFGIGLRFQVEEVMKKIEVRLDSEESFAQIDEDCNLKNGIGIQVAEGDAIEGKKASEEGVDWKTESADEERFDGNYVC